MQKDFDKWNLEKKRINTKTAAPFYKEREIWWCSLGVNVGFEQDGTGRNYDRPVLVIRGFNKETFFGVALTGRRKTGKYHLPLGMIDGREASAVLSQVRLIDTKRLIRKMAMLDDGVFEQLREVLRETLFP
jgi:mRNA interferase MazF